MQCLSLSQLNDLKFVVTNNTDENVFLKVNQPYRNDTQDYVIRLINLALNNQSKSVHAGNFDINKTMETFPAINFILFNFEGMHQTLRNNPDHLYVIFYISLRGIVYILSKKVNNQTCFNIFYNNVDFQPNAIRRPSVSPLEFKQYVSKSPGIKTKIRRSWKGMKEAVRRILRMAPSQSTLKITQQQNTFQITQHLSPKPASEVKQTLFSFNLYVMYKTLKYIAKDLRNLPRTLDIPNKMSYGMVDVRGDGWCGYYALGLINFLKYDRLTQPLDMFNDVTSFIPNPHKPIYHLMDVQEFGIYGLNHRLNIAIYTLQPDDRYILQVLFYNSKFTTWIFPILIGNGHYNILCKRRVTSYQIGFEGNDAKHILQNTTIPNDGTFTFDKYEESRDHSPICRPLHWRQKKRIVKSILQMIPDYTLENETYYIITIIDAWRRVQIPYILNHTLCCIITDCNIGRYLKELRNHFTCGVVYVKTLKSCVLVWSRNTYRIQIGNPVDFKERLDLSHNDGNSFETLSSLCTFLLR
uniref:Uncharacterized protein n=1 Tax=viral metagenome TaxID=1070528 RepID=A0A6C0CMF4_9ZZZZ